MLEGSEVEKGKLSKTNVDTNFSRFLPISCSLIQIMAVVDNG